jgi:hypothetical protein
VWRRKSQSELLPKDHAQVAPRLSVKHEPVTWSCVAKEQAYFYLRIGGVLSLHPCHRLFVVGSNAHRKREHTYTSTTGEGLDSDTRHRRRLTTSELPSSCDTAFDRPNLNGAWLRTGESFVRSKSNMSRRPGSNGRAVFGCDSAASTTYCVARFTAEFHSAATIAWSFHGPLRWFNWCLSLFTKATNLLIMQLQTTSTLCVRGSSVQSSPELPRGFPHKDSEQILV